MHFDWVCVTDAPLVEAYAPLAAHRSDQGLAPLVVALDEVIRWSPAGEDTLTTLRWLATVTANQWGADYLLLGGSHALLPAPIHRLYYPALDSRHPIDAYYRCLDGEWDVDGDGLYAEFEDDAADQTVHLNVGRIPADSPAAVASMVAKIIAFEQRPWHEEPGALFVASLMDADWTPEDIYPNWSLNMAMNRREEVLTLRPEMRAGTLFQSDVPGPPLDDPLNPVALADSLSLRRHDFVYFQLRGDAVAWELVGDYQMEASALDPVENCGHAFLTTMISGSVADTREPGVLSRLVTMADGGAVASIASSGYGYLVHNNQFQTFLMSRLHGGETARVGEAFSQALQDFLDYPWVPNGNRNSTYWYFTLLGDPATLLAPVQALVSVLPAAPPINFRAVPNPFNPSSTLHFDLATRQQARLEIYDLRGRRVVTLVDREMGPGPHAIPWSDAPASGLYFARITTGETTRTVKLTLIE